MNKNILITAKSIAQEKQLDINSVFNALESAIVLLLNRDYGLGNSIRIIINRKTGYYRCFRLWMVSSTEGSKAVGRTISPLVAKSVNPSLVPNDIVEEQIEIPEFDEREIKEYANRFLIKNPYNDIQELNSSLKNYTRQVGSLISGRVEQIESDYVLIKTEDGAQFILLKEEMLPRERLKINQNIKAYLYKIKRVEQGKTGEILFVSRTRIEFLIELLKIFIPEIKEGIIFVRGIARNIGSRTKIAVDSIDSQIDAIGSCIGSQGTRIQDISSMLSGEKIDIVPWNGNPIQFAIHAMAPSTVSSILLYPNNRSMDITISESKLPASVGKLGENVRLASQLIGWNINITMEDIDFFKDDVSKNKHKSEIILNDQIFHNEKPTCYKLESASYRNQKVSTELFDEFKKITFLHCKSLRDMQNILILDREATRSLM